jgi:hypothetical protein
VTTDCALNKVTGILAHPVFSAERSDVLIEEGPCGSVRISGPKPALDRFQGVLKLCGFGIHRTLPGTLLLVTSS